MKFLYFGTVCDLIEYEEWLKNCKHKPTVATINFEASFLKGLKENNADVDVYSFPMIPAFPKSRFFCWGNRKQDLDCGYQCTWLKTLNVPFAKQLIRELDGRRIIKNWLEENKNEECLILTYSVPPFLGKNILKYCKEYGAVSCAIVPDLPSNMYLNSKSNKFIKYIKEKYLEKTLEVQGCFDKYIYLTEAMSAEINPSKPFIVIEGIASTDTFKNLGNIKKNEAPAIMYAGRLHEKYGIVNLLDAFELVKNQEAELWIFGNGTAVGLIEQRASENSRIRYFGSCSREKVLEFEKKAALLINPRDPEEDFTGFSFPSKTIEYMLSGTPLLTTKLPGIPEEYYNYVFGIENNRPETIAAEIDKIFEKEDEFLQKFGKAASEFITTKKNARYQTQRFLDFVGFSEEKNEDGLQ